MIRKNELSFVGGPAEWVIAKQREDARRVATAQRRKGYTSGWYPNAAVATEAMLRAPRTDAVPLSVEAVEWVLSEQPGQRMSVSALNDVFQTHTKVQLRLQTTGYRLGTSTLTGSSSPYIVTRTRPYVYEGGA